MSQRGYNSTTGASFCAVLPLVIDVSFNVAYVVYVRFQSPEGDTHAAPVQQIDPSRHCDGGILVIAVAGLSASYSSKADTFNIIVFYVFLIHYLAAVDAK